MRCITQCHGSVEELVRVLDLVLAVGPVWKLCAEEEAVSIRALLWRLGHSFHRLWVSGVILVRGEWSCDDVIQSMEE